MKIYELKEVTLEDLSKASKNEIGKYTDYVRLPLGLSIPKNSKRFFLIDTAGDDGR